MLRTNHSTWPVDVSQIKQGFIVVKGHSTVSLQPTAFPALSPHPTVSLIYFLDPQLPRQLSSTLPMGPLSTE